MKKLIPELRKKALEDMNSAKEGLKENGRFGNTEADKDDLISKLVEMSMERIKKNLQGLSTDVVRNAEAAGAKMNTMIKDGALAASKAARKKYSVEDFLEELTYSRTNVTAIRKDNPFPEGLVLDISVDLLTGCYREPFLNLLDESCKFLKKEVSKILKDTLGIYPKFLELVEQIALKEIEINKNKAEEYLNIQIDIQRRVVNCDHSEFVKMKDLMKKNKHKNHFDVWFQESIPTSRENDETASDDEDESLIGIGAAADIAGDVAFDIAVEGLGTGGIRRVAKFAAEKVRGFFERLQSG